MLVGLWAEVKMEIIHNQSSVNRAPFNVHGHVNIHWFTLMAINKQHFCGFRGCIASIFENKSVL